MSDASFDLIARELLRQKQVMDELSSENRELRQQIADLRMGRGIFLDIGGKRFSLGEVMAATPIPVSTPSAEAISVPTTTTTTTTTSILPALEEEVVETPTNPAVDVVAEQPEEVASGTDEHVEQSEAPTFLEEVMIDEFSTAFTSPLAVWQGPVTKKEEIDEEQKATLRRELMGSYLLE